MEEYDDIDLRPYLVAVTRRWYWIVVGAMIAALIGAGVSLLLPNTYTATASVLMFIRQTGSQIGVNETIVSIETIDINARRLGLLALAESPAIETQIKPEELQRVAPPEYQPGLLTEQIEIDADGDLIHIAAIAQSPEQAQALADIWASTFVSYAATLYTDEHSQVQLAGKALLPRTPSEPQVVRNAIFAGLVGGALAAMMIVWMMIPSSTRSSRSLERVPAVGRGRAAESRSVARASASQPRGD